VHGLFFVQKQGVIMIKAYIYCRVNPHNKGVAKTDRFLAQQQRCKNFLRELQIYRGWTHYDEGEVHPVNLLPALKELLKKIEYERAQVLVVCDHPGRLGREPDTQKHVRALIDRAGAWFISPLDSNRGEVWKLIASLSGESHG
jgi:hypothetical protein